MAQIVYDNSIPDSLGFYIIYKNSNIKYYPLKMSIVEINPTEMTIIIQDCLTINNINVNYKYLKTFSGDYNEFSNDDKNILDKLNTYNQENIKYHNKIKPSVSNEHKTIFYHIEGVNIYGYERYATIITLADTLKETEDEIVVNSVNSFDKKLFHPTHLAMLLRLVDTS